MIIETSRLVLRPVERGDVDHLHLLDSDPSVMRFVSDGAPTPRETIIDWVIPRAQAELNTGRGGLWMATDRRYGAFLGWMSLRGPRHSSQPEMELSYRLRREYWGRGLATEAARAVTATAFTELGAERVFAGTTATNMASRRVMEKLGMMIARVHLSTEDVLGAGDVEYELLRTQWEARIRRARTTRPPVGASRWAQRPGVSSDMTA